MNEIGCSQGFVLNPDTFYAPAYRISPFTTSDVALNLAFPLGDEADQFFNNKFQGKNWCYTSTGKDAISLALSKFKLDKSDVVSIFTTTDNHYISRCVTAEIEKHCNWSRKIESNSKLIFVNHEFGFPHRDLTKLRSHGLPIIEDACHSFLANTEKNDMGARGDFILYSLPKVFPMQMGGILSANKDYDISSPSDIEVVNYIKKVVGAYCKDVDYYKIKRLENYHYLANFFLSLGCRPFFKLLSNDVPGVFLFVPPSDTNLEAMKAYGWKHGIECSVFYGSHAFFIPVHQNLSRHDLDYFSYVFSSFINR